MSDVKVTLSAQDAQLKAGLASAKAQVDKFAKESEGSFSGMGAKLAGLFTIGGIVAATKSLLDWVGAQNDAADSLNMTRESFQGLTGAFEQSSVSQETFTKGMGKLNQSVQEARDGNEKMIADFEKLGVKWEDVRDKSPEEILYLIADGMKNAKDPTEALAAVMSVLGKAGRAMAAELKGGGDALREHAATVKKLTEEETMYLDKLGDKWDEYRKKAGVLAGKTINFLGNLTDPLPDRDKPKPTAEHQAQVKAAIQRAHTKLMLSQPDGEERLNDEAWDRHDKAMQGQPASKADPRVAKQIEDAAKEVTEQLRKQQQIDDAIRDGELDRAQNLKDRLDAEKKVTEELQKQTREQAIKDYKARANSSPEQRRAGLVAKHRDERQNREFASREKEKERVKKSNDRQLANDHLKHRPDRDGGKDKDSGTKVLESIDKKLERLAQKLMVA